MGSPEIVILIVLGLIILLPILVRAAGRRELPRHPPPSGRVPGTSVRQMPLQPSDLPGVRAAIDRGDWRHAVDLYHEASGLPRDQAESAVMAIVEPGPNQTGVADGDPGDGVDDTRSDAWPELPDRNRREDDR